jgi:WD40 repeat protein
MNGSEAQGRAPPQFGFAASTPSEHGRVAGAPTPAPSVPDHELLRPIGRGSYGRVWLARNVMGAYRAVKFVYRTDFEHDRPFEREFEGIQKFEPVSRTHESQVDILHVGRNEEAGYFYYVMELADDQQTGQQINPETYAAKSLKSELYRRTRLPLEQCLKIGLSLTTALDHLHKHGLVHRDVKPSNIIFINEIPKLADIGLVASLDATMSFVGTAGYLPPEGPGTPQADVYSLGKVLYELCTGRDRLDFPELPTEWQKFVDQQGLLEFNAVLMKACATDVRKRYQSAADMHADLALLQAGKSVKRLRLVEQRLALITRIGLAAAALSVLALGGYFGAVRQARRAERAESEMAQQLYAADINRASQFWEKGNLKRALELLESHRPASKRDRDLRGFEWFYFWRLCHKDDALLTWRAGTNDTLSCNFSLDAKVLVTSGQSGPLMLWDVASKQLLAALTNYSGYYSWAFSFDGNLLAYTSPNSIQLWNIQGKQLIGTLPFTNRNSTCLAFAPGNHLLAVADAESTGITLWNLDSKRPIATLPTDRGGYLTGLLFSSDGKILAAGHRDNIVTFWDPLSRSKIDDLDVPVGFASLLVFSPDNHTLAVGGVNSVVALCDVASRKLIRVLLGHEGQINDVAFSRDGHMIATASDDTTVKLWDLSSPQRIATFKGHLSPVNAVVFSNDGESLFSSASDGVVKQWAIGQKTNADVLLGHTNWARSVAFSSDSKTLASAAKDKTVKLWDVATGQALSTLLGNQRPVLAVAWSSNGQFIASGSGLVTEPDGLGAVILWDFPGRKGCVTLTNQNTPVRSLAFAPDSRTLATGNGNGTVALWDVVNQRLITTWVSHTASVNGLAFSPDSKLLASGSDDNTVKLWAPASHRCLAVLTGSASNRNGADYAIWCVGFSADGRLLAAGHDDGTVTLWSMPSRKFFRTLKGTTGKMLSIAFSPDGKTLAAGNQNNVVTLWHLATGQEMAVLRGHQGFVESVAFSPDGSIVASAGQDNTLRLWRAATRAETDASR